MYWLISPIGLAVALLIDLGRLLGLVRMVNTESLKYAAGRLIIASNHQGYLETAVIPILAWQAGWFRRRALPYSAPDPVHFPWLWPWLKFCVVLVRRERLRERLRALEQLESILLADRRIVLFPEGGRTSSSNGPWVYGQRGKKIRPLRPGLARLVTKTGAPVVPVWCEWSGWHFVIRFGDWKKFHPDFQELEITDRLQKFILELADESG